MGFDDLFTTEYTENLTKELEKLSGNNKEKKSYKDDRIWEAQMDKAGNGMAVIRFLPPPDGEASPAAKLWYHAFTGPSGDWYYKNCLTTIGKRDPVADANNVLWETGIESNQNIARDRKRKLNYYSNIYIVSDPANPENEGKVFLFKYGAKIYEHIKKKTHPDTAFGETPINIFDFMNGADFKLRIRKVGQWANYDLSEWAAPSALLGGNKDELRELYDKLYSLSAFVAPDQFEDYDVLKAKFDGVINPKGIKERFTAEEIEPEEDDIPIGGVDPRSTVAVGSAGGEGEETVADAMDYFKNLAENDD